MFKPEFKSAAAAVRLKTTTAKIARTRNNKATRPDLFSFLRVFGDDDVAYTTYCPPSGMVNPNAGNGASRLQAVMPDHIAPLRKDGRVTALGCFGLNGCLWISSSDDRAPSS